MGMAEQRFTLRGEYDLLNAADLESELLHFAHSNGGGPVTIDGAKLSFIDSSGIGALVRVAEALKSERRALRVVNLPVSARRVVEILSLEAVLGVGTETE